MHNACCADAAAAAANRAASGAEASAAAPAQQLQQRRARAAARRKPHALWINKYTPRGYVDLLSDETINREAAKWLMSWRRCMAGAGEAGGAAHSRGRAAAAPEPKLLLLSGPPGACAFSSMCPLHGLENGAASFAAHVTDCRHVAPAWYPVLA